jgi:hypothetical protein
MMRDLRKLLLLNLCFIFLIAGCMGAAPDLGSSSPASRLDVSLAEGVSSWVVTVRGEGPRWISSDWWRALGVKEEHLKHEAVRLERDGEAVPTLWIESPQGRGMLFYSKPLTGSLQTYLLTLEEQGLEMDVLSPSDSDDSDHKLCQTTTTAAMHLESNQVYRSTAPLEEPWLWTTLRPPQAFSITVPLTDIVESPITMTLQIWGQSRMPVDPDHHLRVSWNGEIVDDRKWDGDRIETWSVDLPQSTRAENTLTLSAPGETEAAVDVMWLDALQFHWRRRLTLSSDSLWTSWKVASSPYACVEGVSDEELVALVVDDQDKVYQGTLSAPNAIDGKALVFQEGGDRGWVGVPWSASEPVGIRPWAGLDVEGQAIKDAEFIILADTLATDAIQPLLDAREAEGLASLLLTPESVYDSFGRGLPEVSAIREMVLHLHRVGRLRYVLLIGDTTSAPSAQQIGAPGELMIPTGWPRTTYVGKTASDSVIATDDQGEPVVALGRIPVTDVQTLGLVIEKTLSWKPTSRMMFVNDDEPEFVGLMNQLSEISPPEVRMGADEPDVRQRVLDWLDEDSGIMVYSGHGSLPVLGDEKLLTREDAGAWEGPTIVVAWSCLCASFAHPDHQSLAETWMLDPRGTVAFVGPTGETTTGEQRAMALAFQQALIDEGRIGDVMLNAWKAAQSDNVKAGFLLLGDPTLRPVSGVEGGTP